MSELTEVIKAPNGTTAFIKPDFGVVLYEEVDSTIYGRVVSRSIKWNADSGFAYSGEDIREPRYDLTLAPQPWYENLSEGILCWVKDKPIPLVVYRYDAGTTNWPLKTGTGSADQFKVEECTPLTSEEAVKYITKQ